MKTINLIICIASAITAISCSLIIEPDINNLQVNLLAPSDGLETPTTTHIFWWDYVADAEGYNIIIVSPGWDSIARLVLDSNITGNKFTQTLTPGEYEWQVSAYNSSSATPYSFAHLTVLSSDDLSQLFVTKTAPVGTYVNYNHITFKWELIPIATHYELRIRENVWEGGDEATNPRYPEEDTISVFLEEGSYWWGVKAHNEYTSTSGFGQKMLVVDTSPPGEPEITFPKDNGDTLKTSPYEIKWKRVPAENQLAPVNHDSLYISSDSAFANIEVAVKQLSTTFSISDDMQDGKYWVRIKSLDDAGNVGLPAERKFYLIKSAE